MNAPANLSFLAKALVILICALWVLNVIQALFPSQGLAQILTVLLACTAIIALPQATASVKILCGALVSITVVLAHTYGKWEAIEVGLARATIFPAFLATIVLLRATADQRREVSVARNLFTALDRERRDSGLVVGGFLIGSILQVGVFAIMAPILGRNANENERQEVFLAAMRGMALVPLWSPFVVGMAVTSQYLPQVLVWQIMLMGLGLSALCIILSIICFDRHGGLLALWRSLQTLAPIAPSIAIAALIVVGTAVSTGLSTLQSLVLALPVPCLLAVYFSQGGSIPTALKETSLRLTRIGPETTILTFATVLGIVFESALPDMGLLAWLQNLNLTPTIVIFVVITAMNLMGVMAIHSIVSGTILLVIFTNVSTGVSDLILMQAVLVGWGLCTAVSLSSLSVVTGATMFEIPLTKALSWSNLVYAFLGGIICALILSAINPVLVV
ncbi:MAG: hypothetical protein CMM52_12265 [Rhodospirillaceae bacterium]|nr:hypothetical protein [Rhodospirillaceae bacterium]|tara:strand:- start:12889 stop:14229 length:1341 start_codon:yes stop_codon:yes gene_type:complete